MQAVDAPPEWGPTAHSEFHARLSPERQSVQRLLINDSLPGPRGAYVRIFYTGTGSKFEGLTQVFYILSSENLWALGCTPEVGPRVSL